MGYLLKYSNWRTLNEASDVLLKLGSTGEEVKAVQKKLGLPETGIYDDATKQKVMLYQADPNNKDALGNFLKQDGIVGPRTREALFGTTGTATFPKDSKQTDVKISPSLSGGFTISDGSGGTVDLQKIASQSIDGRKSIAMSPGQGKGKEFGPTQLQRYNTIKDSSNVHWAVANCGSGQIVAQSKNAAENVYGASVPKILIAAAALANNGGRVKGNVLGSVEAEWKNMINLLVISENDPAWTKTQNVAGGREGVRKFCSNMGYSIMKPERPGGQINALEMVRFYCDVVKGNFAGADAILKISNACSTSN